MHLPKPPRRFIQAAPPVAPPVATMPAAVPPPQGAFFDQPATRPVIPPHRRMARDADITEQINPGWGDQFSGPSYRIHYEYGQKQHRSALPGALTVLLGVVLIAAGIRLANWNAITGFNNSPGVGSGVAPTTAALAPEAHSPANDGGVPGEGAMPADGAVELPAIPSVPELPAIRIDNTQEAIPVPPAGDGSVTSAPGAIGVNNERTGHVVMIRGAFKGSRTVNTCTGSVVSPHYVLTAAHCVQSTEEDEKGPDVPYDRISVYPYGDSGPFEGVAASAWYTSKTYSSKKEWEHWPPSVDFALIRLEEPLEDFTPLALVGKGAPVNNNAYFLGWGAHELFYRNDAWEWAFMPDGSASLMSVPLQHPDACTLGNASGHICAGPTFDPTWKSPTRNSLCMGDSGGPLVVDNNGKLVQIGIASAGAVNVVSKHDIIKDYPWASCGYAPDMYTPVTPITAWMTQVMAADNEAPTIVDLPGINKTLEGYINP